MKKNFKILFMKHAIRKDLEKRLLASKNEENRIVLKTIVNNMSIQKEIRWKAQLSLSDLSKKSSVAQVHKRCILTGRPRFLVKGFNLSRFMIRKLAQDGTLLRKSSW